MSPPYANAICVRLIVGSCSNNGTFDAAARAANGNDQPEERKHSTDARQSKNSLFTPVERAQTDSAVVAFFTACCMKHVMVAHE
jgi:hypothetical protein